MGTNKARINKSIKKILEGKTLYEAKLSIPEITNTIKSNIINNEISENAYQSIIGVVGGKLAKLYLNKEDVEELSDDFNKREQWINEIMTFVESETDENMSEILLKALRIALAETVKEERDEAYFVEKLLYQIVFISLENIMQGALETLDEGLTIVQIRQEFIQPIADNIFEKDVKGNISKLVKGELNLSAVSEQIMDKLKDFGGF